VNAEVARGERALALVDPVLAGLIAAAGPCPLGGGRGHRTNFEALARSIVFQQLAGKAALAIWNRAQGVVEGSMSAAAVLAAGEERLRSAGLSGAKVRALLDLADRVATGDVRLATIGRRSDEAIVAELSRVWGIGRWTAEMFLMFQLGRLDVWPTGDLGVRNGFGRAWGLPEAPGPSELEGLGERFRPWRSIVAWYCWRAVDTVTPG
jgi:3-methyladenine DNA glycosylase/8-oxoguanine DNA glycosylase